MEETIMKNSKKKVRKNSNYKRSATHYNVLARNKYKHDLSKDLEDWTAAEFDFLHQYIDPNLGDVVFLDRIIRDFDVFNITYGEDGKPVTIELSIDDTAVEENKTHFVANLTELGEDGYVLSDEDSTVRGGCGLRFGRNRKGGLGLRWEYATFVGRVHGDRPGAEEVFVFAGEDYSTVMESILYFYDLKAQGFSIFQ
jgi:hypothetical protein